MSGKCIFCDIAGGKSPAKFEYKDSDAIAIKDINPKAPVHILIISKKHIPSIVNIRKEDEQLIGHLVWVAHEIARKKGLNGEGYKLVFNVGKFGGQIIDHIHLHLLGGQPLKNNLA